MRKANNPLLDKRDQNILADFSKYFNKGLRPDVIYKKLSQKYFLSESTVTRIIQKQAKKTVNNNNNHGKK